jgi:hypothetical protein
LLRRAARVFGILRAMRFVVICMLAGCGLSQKLDSSGDDGPPADACTTFSAQADTCAFAMGPALELSGTLEFSTTTGLLVDRVTSESVPVATRVIDTLADPIHAIVAANVTLAPGTTLRAIGSHGFGIIATDSITIGAGALIDVSDNGAGARTALCENGPTKGENDTGGAAGGGGAGFAAAGGPGGDGNSDAAFGLISDGGREGAALSAPDGPRGGCPGAPGGDGNEVGGNGGRGGGAVWLAAGNRIDIVDGGGINAGGAGGGGGIRTESQGDAGGGGGGSGGVIWIEAPRVRSAGFLAANGGGGGEGSGGDSSGAIGNTGPLAITRALGGTGASDSGAAGGAGGYKFGEAGLVAAQPDRGGGGGGGGSVGFIRVVSADQTVAMSSP